jgi:hypothetical protein
LSRYDAAGNLPKAQVAVLEIISNMISISQPQEI